MGNAIFEPHARRKSLDVEMEYTMSKKISNGSKFVLPGVVALILALFIGWLGVKLGATIAAPETRLIITNYSGPREDYAVTQRNHLLTFGMRAEGADVVALNFDLGFVQFKDEPAFPIRWTVFMDEGGQHLGGGTVYGNWVTLFPDFLNQIQFVVPRGEERRVSFWTDSTALTGRKTLGVRLLRVSGQVGKRAAKVEYVNDDPHNQGVFNNIWLLPP